MRRLAHFIETLVDDIRAVRAWMNAGDAADDGAAGHHGWDTEVRR